MQSTLRQSLSLVLTALVVTGFIGTQGWAASGSCQTKTEGKFECMDFTGNLPPYLRGVCGIAASQNTQWVEAPCPQDDMIGFCEVPRDDGVVHRVYCYRMAVLPDGQRLEYCRMGCNGTFSVAPGISSVASGSPVVTSGTSVAAPAGPGVPAGSPDTTPGRPSAPLGSAGTAPGSTGLQVAGKAKAPASTGGDGAPPYVMEYDINRFGEDYKDLDLEIPDPALCAEACLKEAKCRAWSYVKPGVQADNAKCWLKNKVPPPSPDENCVSGINRRKK